MTLFGSKQGDVQLPKLVSRHVAPPAAEISPPFESVLCVSQSAPAIEIVSRRIGRIFRIESIIMRLV
jgi:hypothetical protein